MEIYNVDKVRQQQTFLLDHASFWENAAEYLRTKEIIVSMTKEIGDHSNHVLEIKCKKMDKWFQNCLKWYEFTKRKNVISTSIS